MRHWEWVPRHLLPGRRQVFPRGVGGQQLSLVHHLGGLSMDWAILAAAALPHRGPAQPDWRRPRVARRGVGSHLGFSPKRCIGRGHFRLGLVRRHPVGKALGCAGVSPVSAFRWPRRRRTTSCTARLAAAGGGQGQATQVARPAGVGGDKRRHRCRCRGVGVLPSIGEFTAPVAHRREALAGYLGPNERFGVR